MERSARKDGGFIARDVMTHWSVRARARAKKAEIFVRLHSNRVVWRNISPRDEKRVILESKIV